MSWVCRFCSSLNDDKNTKCFVCQNDKKSAALPQKPELKKPEPKPEPRPEPKPEPRPEPKPEPKKAPKKKKGGCLFPVLAALLLFFVVRNSAAPMSAASLKMGDSTVDVPAGKEVRISFTAPEDGRYVFSSTGTDDPYIFLYPSASGSDYLAYDDDGGAGNNFRTEYDLETGQVVYVGVGFFQESESGSIMLNVSKDDGEEDDKANSPSVPRETVIQKGSQTGDVKISVTSARMENNTAVISGKDDFSLYWHADNASRYVISLQASMGGVLASGTSTAATELAFAAGNLPAGSYVFVVTAYDQTDAVIGRETLSFRIAGDVRTVYALGDVYIRKGPGTDYDTVGGIKAESEAEYTGNNSTDERGVIWYQIIYDGVEGWVSSKYAKLMN